MKKTILSALLSAGVAGVLLNGCTQMPTEKQAISDVRPQVSIKAEEKFHSAIVKIDGLDMGQVGDYLEGHNSLHVLPGMHRITVLFDGQSLLDEKFYLADGVNRTFIVK